MRTALLQLTLLILFPTGAGAQARECVVLRAPTRAPASLVDSAERALADALSQRSQVVISSADARIRMAGQPYARCTAIDCADDVNRYLHTNLAVVLELTFHAGRVTFVNLALVGTEDGDSVGAQAETGGDVPGAVRTALANAWDRWLAAQRGYVSLSSTPEGAFIRVDGEDLGRAPLRTTLSAGVHTIEASLEGRRRVRRDVTVERLTEVEVTLELPAVREESEASAPRARVRPRAAPSESPSSIRAHWANYLVGGALVVLGALSLIMPLDTLAHLGETRPRAGAPDEYVAFGPVSSVLLGLGISGIAGGATWLALQPLREEVPTSPRALLSAGGSF